MQVLPSGVIIQNSAAELGDEPALIRRRVPDAWMGIAKNRYDLPAELSLDWNALAAGIFQQFTQTNQVTEPLATGEINYG